MPNRKYPPAEPITSRSIKRIAGLGLKTPSKLSTKQVQELAASVEAHIRPRKRGRQPAPGGSDGRRKSAPSEYDGSSTAWVAAKSKELYAQYPGRWILVHDARVVADSIAPTDLEDVASRLGIKAPMILRVAPPSKGPARAIYAGQVIRDNHTLCRD